jgi:hypothetical protein
MVEELQVSINKGHQKKVKTILQGIVERNDKSCLEFLSTLLGSDLQDGIIIADLTRAFFRLNRTDLSDCSTIYMLEYITNVNVQEALLEVLGYDRMIPPIEDQTKIIKKYFDFGKGMDMRYFSDPRYGLAAACAGWDENVVKEFLLHCKEIGDAPLKHVAENSLKRKYVKLRSHS